MAPLSKEQATRVAKAEKDYRVALKTFSRYSGEDAKKLNRLGDKMDHAGARLRGVIKMNDLETDQDENFLVRKFVTFLPDRSSRTKKRLRPAPAVRVECSDGETRDLRIDEIWLIE